MERIAFGIGPSLEIVEYRSLLQHIPGHILVCYIIV